MNPIDYLVVDDDSEFRTRLARALERRGFTVAVCASFADTAECLLRKQPARAVVDLRMPGESGIEVLKLVKERFPDTEILILTGYGSIASAVEAMQEGACNYLTKPADAAAILAAFEKQQHSEAYREIAVPSLDQVEREHIQRVLHECGGNVSHAAKRLGMHRRSLQRKLLKIG